MRLSFRATITTVILTVLVLTVTGVGISSYVNARFAAEEMISQILAQTASRTEKEIEALLARSSTISLVNRNLVLSGRLDLQDRSDVTAYFHDVIQAYPELEYISLGFEENGEYCHVNRMADGTYEAMECYRSPEGILDRTDWILSEEVRTKKTYMEIYDYDPRERPFYRAAVEAGRQIWAEAYLFLSPREDIPMEPGLTCSTPIYLEDGSLLGVLTADFRLVRLSQFLRSLPVGKTGFAFVIEQRRSGESRVIAHPEHGLLVEEKGTGEFDLISPDRIQDGRVQEFITRIPEGGGQVRFDVDGVPHVGGTRPLEGEAPPPWIICSVLPEDDVMAGIHRNNRNTVLIGLVSIIIGVGMTVLISRRISSPLRRLAGETEAIGDFRLDPRPEGRSRIIEVDRLLVGMEEMKAGLRSFQKYVPAELVRKLLAAGEEAVLGGHRANLSVYFSDIAGFTSMSEGMSPEALVEILGDYLGAMSREIQDEGGTVDKYIGDAIMAFWGAPTPREDHAEAACSAALRNQRVLADLRERWIAEGKPPIRMRIGINSGDLIVGNMGADFRMDYTVFGDTVNLASRLEGLNKHYGTEIMISEGTYREVSSRAIVRPLDRVTVKGKTRGILVYELLGLGPEGLQEIPDWAVTYGEGFETYLLRDWKRARSSFEETLQSKPGDVAARTLLDRCIELSESPPSKGWDGTRRMESK